MAHRLIELQLPGPHVAFGIQALEGLVGTAPQVLRGADGRGILRATVDRDRMEGVLDGLEDRFEGIAGFALHVIELAAVLPRPVEPAETPSDPAEAAESAEAEAEASDAIRNAPTPGRISRAELYDDVEATIRLDTDFLAQAAIATVVAAIGLIQDSPAVIIGAMVIAPLLGPHMALALATALGDGDLARRAIRASLAGSSLTVLVAAALGAVLTVDPSVAAIAARTTVGTSDIVLALASGVAGALGFTAGLSTTLVGVMVAVALAPPAVTMAMLLVTGHFDGAIGAGLLLATNLVCVNLAAVVTFGIKGLRPRRWWEAGRARSAMRRSILGWAIMLAVIAALITVVASRAD